MSGSNFSSILPGIGFFSTSAKTSADISRSFERLSSGLRINSASDDAAGLALSNELSLKSQLYARAAINISDGTSLVNVADASVATMQDIVQRLKELAKQGESSVLTTTQRGTLQTEADALITEYNRVLNDTTFNTIQLLDGTSTARTIQAGVTSQETIAIQTGSELEFSYTLSETTGTGTFSGTTSTVLSSISAMSSGDFDEDGDIDLVTYRGANAIDIQLSNGDGTFEYAGSHSFTGGATYRMAVADFNNDGFLDLAKTEYILLGNGDGTFKTQMSHNQTVSSYGVYAGDFNNDGNQDLIGWLPNTGSNYGTVQLGNGNGSFTAPVIGILGTNNANNYNVTVHDVNNDGSDDFIAIDATDAYVFISNGNGTFKHAVTYSLGASAYSGVTMGDMNGDSIMDIVAVHGTPGLSVLIGNADGTFKRGISGYDSTVVGAIIDVAVGDFNSDGKMDAITTNGFSNSFSIWIGNGNGTFDKPISYVGQAGYNPVVADFDGDEIVDVAWSGDFVESTYVSLNGSLTTNTDVTAREFEIELDTVDHSEDATIILDSVAEALASERGILGAQLSRLDVAFQNAQAIQVNYADGAARIRDIDVASELSKFVRLQILQEGQSAILGQANKLSSLSLSLLEDSLG